MNDLVEITAGCDGNLWFDSVQGNRIGRITPKGKVTEFSTGIAASLNAILSGGVLRPAPDGNLWFTSGKRIGRITPDGKVTKFSVGITAKPSGITVGPDGNLWFTERGAIGRIGTGAATKSTGRHGSKLPAACPRAGD